MKGIIISIEGTDGAGKHTQQTLLGEDLINLGYNVFNQSFPNYESKSSEPVKMYLGGEFGEDANCLNAYEASVLYATDRLCTYKKTIKPHYDNGEIILLDRYVQSNFIHQCSKINDETEKEQYLKWVQEFEFDTLNLPRPDLVFFVEMPVKKSIELAKARESYKTGTQKDIHELDSTYLEKSYNNGLSLAKKFNWILISCVDENDNIKPIEQIHSEIMKITLDFLNKKRKI